jgi:hypothetical protein
MNEQRTFVMRRVAIGSVDAYNKLRSLVGAPTPCRNFKLLI